MYKRIIYISIFFFLVLQGHATHLIGGEIYYDCLGNNQFRVTLKIYRDCSPANTNGTPFDSQAKVGVFNAAGNEIMTLHIGNYVVHNIPVSINNPCLLTPPNACVEEAVYQMVVTIPYYAGGVDLVYQRCCRNPTIVNIVQPQDYGNTYWAHIPDIAWSQCNSSPRFKNFPPVAICTNNLLSFDHSAIDPDGDSLVYEFATPYHGGSTNNPMPNPSPPPFSSIIWNTGYSVNYQMNASPPLTIHPSTGLLTGQPTQQGQYVIGIKVKEYRNGIFLSENLRDFQFNVALCDPMFVAGIAEQEIFCDGKTVQFQNSSINGNFYYWDFGDPQSAQDTSTQPNPVYTYTDTGTYTVMLIVNPGWPCADTAYQTFEVRTKLDPYFIPPSPQCLNGNNFSFHAQGIFDPQNATYWWDFGPNATPPVAAVANPSGIMYDIPGFFPVKLTIAHPDGCEKTYIDTVKVYPHPQASFAIDSAIGCVPYTVTFHNTSYSWTPLQCYWTFGDGAVSYEHSPIHTYQDAGTYTVTLTVISTNGCLDTSSVVFPDYITVYPIPKSYFFLDPDTIDIFNNQYYVYSYPSLHTDCYFIMPDGSIHYDCHDFSSTMPDSGTYLVAQVTINEFGCADTAKALLRVNPVYFFYIPNAFTPDGDGINDFFRAYMHAVKEFEMWIYDRWGERVFHTTCQTGAWDGTLQDEPAPMGVYAVRVSITDVFGEHHEYTNTLTLIR